MEYRNQSALIFLSLSKKKKKKEKHLYISLVTRKQTSRGANKLPDSIRSRNSQQENN